jgi:hypothetical protein
MHATADDITLPCMVCVMQLESVTYRGTDMFFDCLRLVCGLVLMSALLVPKEDTTILKDFAIPFLPWFVFDNLPF